MFRRWEKSQRRFSGFLWPLEIYFLRGFVFSPISTIFAAIKNLMKKSTRVYGTEEAMKGPALFNQQCGLHHRRVSHHSHLGYISGAQGTLKSTVLRYWIAAALSGNPQITFDYDLQDKCVILCDGEQPPDIFSTSVNQTLYLAGRTEDERLIAHSLTDYISHRDKQEKLFELTSKYRSDLGLLILDGIKNFVGNPNDQEGCSRFISNILAIGKRTGCITVILSHITQQAGNVKLYGWGGSILHDLASFGYRMERSGKYFVLKQVKTRYAPTSPVILSFGKDLGTLEAQSYYPF